MEWEHSEVPTDYWPSTGDSAWVWGRWVWDCGHPQEGSFYTTEIHLASATAFSRYEPVIFNGYKVPSMATVIHLYIHGRGGIYNTPVPATSNGHYQFDIAMPPKPSSDAVPHTEIISTIGNASNPNIPPPELTVDTGPNNEGVAPAGGAGGGPIVHVDYDLSSVKPSIDNTFGVTMAAGWLEPKLSNDYHMIQVNFDALKINNCHDCNNWSLWADFGNHWIELGDPTFSGANSFCDVGKTCAPVGTIVFPPGKSITLLVTPQDPTNSILSLHTTGFSWARADAHEGVLSPQGVEPLV